MSSGKPHALVDVAAAHRDGVSVIKRYSGGGTVIVDADTQFVSLILNGDATPDVQLFPVPLMRWTGKLYGDRGGGGDDDGDGDGEAGEEGDDVKGNEQQSEGEGDGGRGGDPTNSNPTNSNSHPGGGGEPCGGGVFSDVTGFRLRENDYVVGVKKVGGNAQSISKNRWVHHTSFLWDFREEMMRYLKHPAKTPAYRDGRGHLDFLTPLREVLPTRDIISERIEPALRSMGLQTTTATLEEAEAAVFGLPHHRTTAVVDLKATLEVGPEARPPLLPNPPIAGVA